MPIAPRTRLGAYEILSPVGAGGMGEVYRARDTKLARMSRSKILPDTLAGDAATRARFEREAHAVAALSRPDILGIYDFVVDGRLPYAVLELLDGATLRDRLNDGAVPRVLRSRVRLPREAVALLAAKSRERDVSWSTDGYARDIAAGGRAVLWTHFGERSGPYYSVYFQRAGARQGARIGEGEGTSLSPVVESRWRSSTPRRPARWCFQPAPTIRSRCRAGGSCINGPPRFRTANTC